MKGDFTRFTFNPAKRYTQVLKQQGRVDVDADWNEFGDILDYLDRTTRIDVIGKCGVPIHAPGFGITHSGGADLDISAGRMYVAGILAELAASTTYLTQPDLPNPPPLAPIDGRRDLVFIDVWERHITAIEDPEIREVALGGPDTTTRVKTIAQIRVTQGLGFGVDCPNAPLPNPSGARLTSSVVPVPPSDDPCLIAPTGGYKGLENRLYRVEIHDPGALGAATFKWSRDNGSVVFSVTEFPGGQPTKVRMSRLGRDEVLALHFGDWVEVLGDESELSGTPGTLAQIIDIDEANLEITLSKNVSAHSGESHPKVRRWDQPSDAIATGAGPFELEDGVQVEFSGADFRTGDYWTFAARTATGDIDHLTIAEPQGIIHHYCPLAIVTWNVAAGNITAEIKDCREKFPPLTEIESCCCCTVTVGDGDISDGDFTSIAAALAVLEAQPGKEFVRLCVLPGVHDLDATVNITRSNLTISGCGRQSVIRGPNNGPAFFVDAASNVSFEDLAIAARSADASIVGRGVIGLTIARTDLGPQNRLWALILQGDDIHIYRNEVQAGVWIQDGSEGVRIHHNRITGGLGPGIGLGGVQSEADLPDDDSGVREVEIVRNHISLMNNSGITTVLAGDAGEDAGIIEGLAIEHNVIERCARQDPVTPFHDEAVGGIVLQETIRLRIRDNRIVNNGTAQNIPACGVFLFFCADVEIADNVIEDNGVSAPPQDCIDFSALATDQGPNPRIVSNTTFQVFTFNNTPQTFTAIQQLAASRGLNVGFRTLVTLPAPASTVELDLVHFSSAGTVRALGAGGTVLATHTMINPQQTPETVVLNAAGITQVEIVAPQDEMLLLRFCTGAGQPDLYQGGIIAFVFGEQVQGQPVPGGGTPSFWRGDPALAVRNNSIVTPAGQALMVAAIAPVAVTSNSFTCLGPWDQPNLGLQATAIHILNLGQSFALPRRQGGFTGVANIDSFVANPVVQNPLLLDGRVQFHDNQVTCRPLGTVPPVIIPCLVATLDDASFQDNQVLCDPGAAVVLADVLAFGITARVCNNRISETPLRALFSSFTVGQDVMVSLNQTMHCIGTLGARVFDPTHATNQIAINNICEVLNGVFN